MACCNDDSACAIEHHRIDILNWQSGDEVCYSVVIIEGLVKTECKCTAEKSVEIERIDGPWSAPSSTTHFLGDNFTFKCILKLQHGTNMFLIKYCSVQKEFHLYFRPRQTQFSVVPVYIICKGHDGRFQAPENEDNSVDSACDRISTGVHLLQSLLAEELNKFGCGRQTFQLDSDLKSTAPECHVFYSNVSVQDAHAAEADTLWTWIGRELMKSPLGRENSKFVAFLSSTYYEGKTLPKFHPTHEDIINCTRGHVALGGGGLALVHTGCLYTWATSTEEVVSCLLSTQPVDTEFFMDDSNHRGTYGGCYTTSLGIVAHEMGHTFDLGHTTHGIMGPDYHNIHHMFLSEGEKLPEVFLTQRKCPREGPSPDGNQTSVKIVRDLKTVWKAPQPQELRNQFLSKKTIASVNFDSVALDAFSQLSLQFKNHEESKKVHTGKDAETKDFLLPTLDRHDVSSTYAQSCLAFLAFNRWINPLGTEDSKECLSFDKLRGQITSSHGLRVIDVRDASQKSLLHWKFLKIPGLTSFIIPKHCIFPEAHSLCIIDSLGNVLKPDLHQSDPPERDLNPKILQTD